MPNTLKLAGHVFDNTGAAVAATVQRYEVGTTTTFGSSTTASGSTGKWAFTDGQNGYDVKITYGTNVRWLKGLDELQVSELAIIQSTEGAAANFYIAADQADDDGDSWRIQASDVASGANGTLAIANNENATNTFVDQLTLTAHATPASTVLTLTGQLVATSLDINGAADISGDLTLSAGGDGALVFATAGENSIKIPDNQGSALIIEEANNAYMTFVTTDSSEAVSIAKTLTLSTVAAAGTDTDKFLVLDSSGNVDYRTGTEVLSDIGAGSGDMTSFQLEDDDGTEVTISNAKEVKFIGSGITTNWTDTDAGTDGDPYDLTFTVDAAQTGITSIIPTATAHDAAGTAVTISGGDTTAGTTNNIAGGALTLQGGQGKGSGAGGDIIFQTANAGGSGSSLNSLATALTISDDLSSTFADNVLLNSDGAVLYMGADNDFSITHDGTSGATLAGNPITITAAGAPTWSTSAGALTVSGKIGLNLQEDGATIIGISNSRAVSTTNTASIDLDASGAIQINSTGGALSVGNDNVDQAVNIATAGTRALNIGIDDGTDVTSINVNASLRLGGSRMATAEPASNTSGYGIVIGFDSAGSVAAGDAVYIDSNGKVAQARADTGNVTDPAIGIATNAAGSDGDDCYVLTHGIWRMDAEGFTAGDPVYLGESAGALTATVPSDDGDYVQRIGIAVTDDCILVMPSIDVIEHD